jgi:DNA-directed RNA polymerase subunit beta'
MGHIALVSPVTNTLILKIIFPYIEKLLGISSKTIKDLIYFNSYIVTDKGKSKILQNKQVLTSKVELDLINNVLSEIIQNKKVPSDTLKEAQELQADLISQKEVKTGSQSESEAIFLEDYLEFLCKH